MVGLFHINFQSGLYKLPENRSLELFNDPIDDGCARFVYDVEQAFAVHLVFFLVDETEFGDKRNKRLSILLVTYVIYNLQQGNVR